MATHESKRTRLQHFRHGFAGGVFNGGPSRFADEDFRAGWRAAQPLRKAIDVMIRLGMKEAVAKYKADISTKEGER